MHQPVIRLAAPGNAWERSRHPDIERLVQKQVRKSRAAHAALWCPLGTLYQGSIGKVHRRFQPAFTVPPHPFARRMLVDRSQQKRVGDVVEETCDVT
ncbi:MAG TPA: hypothetical protein VI542_27150, partial [Candidatus Tectomicrobia bacterium]